MIAPDPAVLRHTENIAETNVERRLEALERDWGAEVTAAAIDGGARAALRWLQTTYGARTAYEAFQGWADEAAKPLIQDKIFKGAE